MVLLSHIDSAKITLEVQTPAACRLPYIIVMLDVVHAGVDRLMGLCLCAEQEARYSITATSKDASHHHHQDRHRPPPQHPAKQLAQLDMPEPVPPSFPRRFSTYHLLGIFNQDAPLPEVGTRVTVSDFERLGSLCALRNFPFEDLEVHSHFDGDAVERSLTTGFFIKLIRSNLTEPQLLRLWHRGLFQLPVGCTSSEDPMDSPPVLSPYQTHTQVRVRAFAVAADADLDRVKTAFDGENDELILCPWAGDRARWQPVDYANEAARLATADLRQPNCSLNPFAVVLVGGAETRHEDDPEQDVVTVVVPWRQIPTTLDPLRTFNANVGVAKSIISAMGGLMDSRLVQSYADELLDDDPAAILRSV